MRKIIIRVPIFKTRSIGIADYKITEDLEIYIDYRTKDKELLYPYIYSLTKEKAKKYPIQFKRGVMLRIIPIEDLTIKKERN